MSLDIHCSLIDLISMESHNLVRDEWIFMKSMLNMYHHGVEEPEKFHDDISKSSTMEELLPFTCLNSDEYVFSRPFTFFATFQN